MKRIVRAICLAVVTAAAIPAVAALVWALYRLADKVLSLTEER